jgi:hypothetical protein
LEEAGDRITNFGHLVEDIHYFVFTPGGEREVLEVGANFHRYHHEGGSADMGGGKTGRRLFDNFSDSAVPIKPQAALLG